MSNICVCIEEKKNENNIDSIDVKYVTEYRPQKGETVYMQTDYMGNIYLKHNDQYYIVSLDSYHPSGVELNRIEKPNIFRKNLIESRFLKDAIKSGVIKANNTSLTGKAYESINDMTDEEHSDYMTKNDFSSFDSSFYERKYYWIQYKEEDELLEGEEDDGFYLNGISEGSQQGMMYSELLSLNPGTFDTILIQGDTTSKNVVSTTERIDGYCTARLTVYTSGHFRPNFMDSSRLSRLCIVNQPKSNNPEESEMILIVKKVVP
jgi:hypothetical protein